MKSRRVSSLSHVSRGSFDLFPVPGSVVYAVCVFMRLCVSVCVSVCDDDDGGAGAGTGLGGSGRDEGGRIHGPVPPRATGTRANMCVKTSARPCVSVSV